jgi:hypothetical protein
MKSNSIKPKQLVKPIKRIYTYNVICSFNLQYSFTESEVEQDPGGDEGDFNPTDKAIRTLEKDLQETLGHNYAITKFEAYAESDELLGISDKKGNIIPPNHAA